MLKIHEEVDLKELEKFGFKDNNGYLIKTYKQEFAQGNDFITINKKDKTIRIAHYQEEYGTTNIVKVADTLYDLIQADLVIKE